MWEWLKKMTGGKKEEQASSEVPEAESVNDEAKTEDEQCSCCSHSGEEENK